LTFSIFLVYYVQKNKSSVIGKLFPIAFLKLYNWNIEENREMKRTLMVLMLFVVFSTSIALAADVVDKNFQVGSRMGINLHTGESQDSSQLNIETYLGYKISPLIEVEVSSGLLNEAPVLKDSTTSVSGNPNETNSTLTVKIYPFKISFANVYFGVGAQYTQAGGEYQTNSFTVDNAYSGPLSGDDVIVGTRVLTKYPLKGSGVSTVFQVGADFPIFRDDGGNVNGMSIGIDIKYTPWASTTLELSKEETSVNNGPWTASYGDDVIITKWLQGSVSLTYNF
jgi:hypothetical protein